jgi:hypothetical protein
MRVVACPAYVPTSMSRFFWSSLRCRGALLLVAAALSFACASSGEKTNDACTPDDGDGIISEPANPILTVTDSGFMPLIVTTQNTSDITLTLRNEGARPHSFVIDCKSTANSDGCPMQSCFPSEARIDALAPGDQATIMFQTPLVEGIYDFHSDLPEDAELAWGQFVIL